jgi:hypothetical protein
MARQEFLERLADNHEIQIKKTLEDLEARIVSQISTVTEGADAVSTKIAIELRTDLKQYIDETYRTTADNLVRDYDQIVNEFMEEFGGLDIPDKFKSLTKVDLLTINQLKFQQFAGFEDLANRYLNEISSQVYQNAIAGKPFNEMVKDLRGLITGDVDRRGRPMSTYASQIAHDSVMQFDGQFTVYKSKEAGLNKFKYTGTLVTDSRPHCVTHLNKVYTEEQIRSIWQGSWAGKSEGDPFTVRGGYRCRHTWLPVADEFFDAEEPQEEPDFSNILTDKNTFTYDKNININEFNNALNNLEGQQEVTKKIFQFINAKNITTLYLPRSFSRKTVREKYINDINKIYKKNSNKELPNNALVKIGRLNGVTSKQEDFIAVFADPKEKINFSKANIKELQDNVEKALNEAKNNNGKFVLKRGTDRFNLNFSLSHAQSSNLTNGKISTTLHELGHQVHYWATNEAGDYARSLSKKITVLGETNDKEYFAELFTAYSLNKKALKAFDEELHDRMEELLDMALKSKTKFTSIEF